MELRERVHRQMEKTDGWLREGTTELLPGNLKALVPRRQHRLQSYRRFQQGLLLELSSAIHAIGLF